MKSRFKRLILTFRIAGFGGFFLHVLSKFLPPARFRRQATLLDFKKQGFKFADDVWQMLSTLGIDYTTDQAIQIQAEFMVFSENPGREVSEESFPHNWNSGESLRLLLFAFVRLMKPESVIETGTANGYSTSAIAYALELNGMGKVHTFDILESKAQHVFPTSRSFVEIHRVSEDPKSLYATARELPLDAKKGFYFHDADHSYFGQYNDYELARILGFKYYISDDVETSMVFCEKAARGSSSILFDGRKFIGATII